LPGFESPEFASRWQTLTLMEQFGNIGSEVARALSWMAREKPDFSTSALYRSLMLIDLTIADSRRRSAGTLTELARLREVLCDFFVGGNQYGSSPEFFRQYFYSFAAAARRNRES
jgi:hypothetical protein